MASEFGLQSSLLCSAESQNIDIHVVLKEGKTKLLIIMIWVATVKS
jgi:hypothetical protein